MSNVFLELHSQNYGVIYINPNQIKSFNSYGVETQINVAGDSYFVEESIETIKTMLNHSYFKVISLATPPNDML